MAIMIPPSIPVKSTNGEKRLFKTLEEFLPEDVIVYYEPMIGRRKPDYVLIIPSMGVLVLEVKDYKKGTIKEINTSEWMITDTSGKPVQITNPLSQAREYCFSIASKLKEDPRLVHDTTGRLKVPYAFGTVFTRLSDLDVVTMQIDETIPTNLILCDSDINPDRKGFDGDSLIDKLQSMFNFKLKESLSEEEINAIRYNLFPEVRIGSVKSYKEDDLLKLRTLKAMSVYQEVLAKQLGNGHRMIRGVAGSGKTLVLIARAKMLALDNPDWNILIVCYGVVLSRSMKSYIGEDKAFNNIQVKTFHEFLAEDLKVYNDAEVEGFVNTVEVLKPRLPKFDAILVDEGQDFESEWLKLLHLCLNPATASFFLAEDRAQDIFRKGKSLSKTVGLDFRGRSRVLSINYRNTKNVIEYAWNFYKNFVPEDQRNSDILEPRYTLRKGLNPLFKKFNNFKEESSWVSREIESLLCNGYNPNDIAILYRVKKYNGVDFMATLSSSLDELGIEYFWVSKDRKSKASFGSEGESVKVLTLDSSKGVDFRAVFLINVDNMPFELDKDLVREASLLYIGMTRTTELLYLSCSGHSEFVEYFERGKG